MNLVKMVAIYLLTVLSEGENIRFVFIGSLDLSHPKESSSSCRLLIH